jgi:hypothetical protein
VNVGVEVEIKRRKRTDKAFMIEQITDNENIQCGSNKETIAVAKFY